MGLLKKLFGNVELSEELVSKNKTIPICNLCGSFLPNGNYNTCPVCKKYYCELCGSCDCTDPPPQDFSEEESYVPEPKWTYEELCDYYGCEEDDWPSN